MIPISTLPVGCIQICARSVYKAKEYISTNFKWFFSADFRFFIFSRTLHRFYLCFSFRFYYYLFSLLRFRSRHACHKIKKETLSPLFIHLLLIVLSTELFWILMRKKFGFAFDDRSRSTCEFAREARLIFWCAQPHQVIDHMCLMCVCKKVSLYSVCVASGDGILTNAELSSCRTTATRVTSIHRIGDYHFINRHTHDRYLTSKLMWFSLLPNRSKKPSKIIIRLEVG